MWEDYYRIICAVNFYPVSYSVWLAGEGKPLVVRPAEGLSIRDSVRLQTKIRDLRFREIS